MAIEVKSGNLANQNFAGLHKFDYLHRPRLKLVVANLAQSRAVGKGLTILTLADFVRALWSGQII